MSNRAMRRLLLLYGSQGPRPPPLESDSDSEEELAKINSYQMLAEFRDHDTDHEVDDLESEPEQEHEIQPESEPQREPELDSQREMEPEIGIDLKTEHKPNDDPDMDRMAVPERDLADEHDLDSKDDTDPDAEAVLIEELNSEPEYEPFHKPARRSRRRANRRTRKPFDADEPGPSSSMVSDEPSEDDSTLSSSLIFTFETKSPDPYSEILGDTPKGVPEVEYPTSLDESDSEGLLRDDRRSAVGKIGSAEIVQYDSEVSETSTGLTSSTVSVEEDGVMVDEAMVEALLTVKPHVLRVTAEIRRLFGADDTVFKSRKPSVRERLLRRAIIVDFPEEQMYPRTHEVNMAVHRDSQGIQIFTFEHSTEHQLMHRKFIHSLNNPRRNEIFNMENALRRCHVEGLLEIFDDMCREDNITGAHNLIQHIVALLQYSAMPSFNLAERTTRLPYMYVENRPYFIALLKYAYLLSNKACHRNALEICKLLINLDRSDPLALLFVVDTFAIRSREFRWLVDVLDYWSQDRGANFMFNIIYSHALAFFHCVKKFNDDDDLLLANELIQNAIVRFPYVVTAITSHMNTPAIRELRENYLFDSFAHANTNTCLRQLMNVYGELTWSRWNEPGVLTWLIDNALLVAQRFITDEMIRGLIYDFADYHKNLFVRLPVQVLRHMCVLKPMANLILDGMEVPAVSSYYAFDPLPPIDTIDRYGYSRGGQPPAPLGANWYAFFTSILPFRDPGA